MRQGRIRHAPGRIAAIGGGALLFCGAAAAQGDPGGLLDRYPSPAAGWERPPDRTAGEAFARGYRAGREAERRRAGGERGSGGVGRPSLARDWTDEAQQEAYRQLRRAEHALCAVVTTMETLPSLPRNQGVLLQARQALVRTRNAMSWLPDVGVLQDAPGASAPLGSAGRPRG